MSEPAPERGVGVLGSTPTMSERDSLHPPTLPGNAAILVHNQSMRARSHPFVVLALWAWTAFFGWALSWPFTRVVASAYGGHPRGDGPLYDPGALALYDLVHRMRESAPALAGHVAVVMPLALVFGLLPLAALLVAVAHAARDRRALRAGPLLRRGVRAMPALFVLFVAMTALEGVLVVLAVVSGGAAGGAFAASGGEARGDQLGVAVGALLFVIVAAVGVVHDLARAAIVRFRVSALRATVLAWKTFRRAPIGNLFSWGWRAAAAIVPVVAGSLALERLGGPVGGAVWGLFAIHQIVVATRVAMRASWLACAMRAIDSTHREVRTEPFIDDDPEGTATTLFAGDDEKTIPIV